MSVARLCGAVFSPQDASWLSRAGRRLRTKVSVSPTPMKAKLNVARKHMPTISVLRAVAMLWAIWAL